MVLTDKDSAAGGVRIVARTLFVVAAGALFAVALGAFIRPEAVAAVKAKVRYPLMVLYAELIGFIPPGPRYVSYPILVKLKELGLDAGIIFAPV